MAHINSSFFGEIFIIFTRNDLVLGFQIVVELWGLELFDINKIIALSIARNNLRLFEKTFIEFKVNARIRIRKNASIFGFIGFVVQSYGTSIFFMINKILGLLWHEII